MTLQGVVLTLGHAAPQVTSVVCFVQILPTFFLSITFLKKFNKQQFNNLKEIDCLHILFGFSYSVKECKYE